MNYEFVLTGALLVLLLQLGFLEARCVLILFLLSCRLMVDHILWCSEYFEDKKVRGLDYSMLCRTSFDELKKIYRAFNHYHVIIQYMYIDRTMEIDKIILALRQLSRRNFNEFITNDTYQNESKIFSPQ